MKRYHQKLVRIAFLLFFLASIGKGSDFGLYIGSPNPGWYDPNTMLVDSAKIVTETVDTLFDTVAAFDDQNLNDLRKWVLDNLYDDELDIIWLPGVIPSVLYPNPNLSPDDSLAEKWLDNGNMIINIADWFAYTTYENGGNRGPDNRDSGAVNILDMPNIIRSTDLEVYPTENGLSYLPCLIGQKRRSVRPVHIESVGGDWEVSVVFESTKATLNYPDGSQENGTYAGSLVLKNRETKGYLAILDQNDIPKSAENRANLTVEFLHNWVAKNTNLKRRSITIESGVGFGLYNGFPSWYDQSQMQKDVIKIATQLDKTIFDDVASFGDQDHQSLQKWVVANMDDDEVDILWLPGTLPGILYPNPNLLPDGSLIEQWLDNGNMLINTADWFAFVVGDNRKNNEQFGAENILDLPSIITFGDNTGLLPTSAGRRYLPTIAQGSKWITDRPIKLSSVKAPWQVAEVFARLGDFADPVVLHNQETGGYIAFVGQAGPNKSHDRAQLTLEFVGNWVTEKIELKSTPKFLRQLVKGLNLISLPLQPRQPMTAASLIDVGATMVIRLDEDEQIFVPYLPGISNDFAIQGAAGYIVNLKQSREVTFTGTAWDNTQAAPSYSPSPTWAFVLGGEIDPALSVQQVTLFNPRTGLTSTADVTEQSYSLAIADLNRRSVVEVGDRLEIRLGSERLYYRIQPNDLDRASARVDLKPIDFLPHQTRVLQNYPNPFNPETWIPFQLAEDGLVELEIFDLAGERIRSLDLGLMEAGKYLQPNRAIYWDGQSELGERVSSGVYFYYLQTDHQTQTRKMVILK